MRSPLGELLHNALDPPSETNLREFWRDFDHKLAELCADYIVQLELLGYGGLAARIEQRIIRVQNAVESQPRRIQSEPDTDAMTLEAIRDALFFVDATDRRVHALNNPPSSSRDAPISDAPAANAENSGDGESDPKALALTENEVAVINALAKFDPRRLASGVMIEDEMDGSIRLTRRTIQPIVSRLIELDLAERPRGERSGVRLTLAGRRLASKIAD